MPQIMEGLQSAGSVAYDALSIPGGQQSVDTLMTQGDTLHFINETFKHGKTIGGTNEEVDILAGSETQGQITSELGVITIRNAQDLTFFIQEFILGISSHRHWARKSQEGMVPA